MGITTKISVSDGEYRVRLFIDTIYQAGADYFTDDKADAVATGAAMIKTAGLSDKTTDFARAEQADFEAEQDGVMEKSNYELECESFARTPNAAWQEHCDHEAGAMYDYDSERFAGELLGLDDPADCYGDEEEEVGVVVTVSETACSPF